MAEEKPCVAAELVLNRLRYPYQLMQKAKEEYERYMTAHIEDVAAYLIEREDIQGLAFLADKNYWNEAALNDAIQRATEGKKTEVLSLLMDEKHRRYPKKKKIFEL